jgi:hypothetical protein
VLAVFDVLACVVVWTMVRESAPRGPLQVAEAKAAATQT